MVVSIGHLLELNQLQRGGKPKILERKSSRMGKGYYWCPEHVVTGDYDRLYVTHPPEKHGEGLDRKKCIRGNSSCGQRDFTH